MLLSFLQPTVSRWVLTVKWAAAALAALFVFSIANHNFVLAPQTTSTYRPGNADSSIQPVASGSLVRTADAQVPWRFTEDTFPFVVTIPRLVEAVRVRATLQPGTQPYVLFTALGHYDSTWTHILSSKVLDTLSWKHITADGLTLWLRDADGASRAVRQYSSLQEFFNEPPPPQTIGTAGLDPMTFAVVPNYKPSTQTLRFPHTFRGSHRLYLYAQNEQIDFSLSKIDLNRQVGKDEMTVRIIRADRYRDDSHSWLQSVTVKDDGNASASGNRGAAQHVQLQLPAAAPGMYRVEIATNEDVVFSELSSAQSTLAFWGQVWFADGPAYGVTSFAPLNLQTDGGWVTMSPSHSEGKQVASINGKPYSLQKVKKVELLNGLQGTTSITVPKGDLTIASDKLITLSPALLAPASSTLPINLAADESLDSYDYILAPYHPRKTADITLDQTFLLSDLELQGKKLHFSIFAPNLKTTSSTLGLENIRVTFERGPFPWVRVWHRLRKIIHAE